MAYNQLAEHFSRAAAVPFSVADGGNRHSFGAGVSFPEGWSRFDQVYSDIADATPTDQVFRTMDLLEEGALPSIAGYALKTRREIVQVVLRDMLSLPAEADGLVRVHGGLYRWRFADLQAAA